MQRGDRVKIKEGFKNAGRQGTIVERARGLNNNGEFAVYWENDKMHWIDREKIELVKKP